MDKAIDFNCQPILIKEAENLTLTEQGYVVFPFLDKGCIEKLSHYYFEFQKEDPTHFYSSTHSANFEFRKKTSDFIKEIISPLASNFLKDYKLLGGAFVVKPANGKGILQPHQDWNLVDETKTRSYNLWIPLVDVTVENGAVFVLPESHSKLKTYRGPGIPSLFKDIELEVWNNLKPLPMSAGEALLYDHALLHGSPINTSDKVRIGIVCGIIHKNSEMQLCFNNETNIGVYKIDENFFLDKNPMNGPGELVLLRNMEHQFSSINNEEFKSIFLKSNFKPKYQWFKKIFG